MLKKWNVLKNAQLVVYILLAAVCMFVFVVMGKQDAKTINTLLWITLAISFLFLSLDFKIYAEQTRNYKNLVKDMQSDPVANIANRYTVDAMMDKYDNLPVPKDFACIVMAITNIREINEKYGRKKGNETIREFSLILKMASVNHCFVGRNGGNRFIAVFESATDEKMEHFLNRISKKVHEHNDKEDNCPIEYAVGTAFHEGDEVKEVTDLVALADARVEGDQA